jgi:hypothetical protein
MPRRESQAAQPLTESVARALVAGHLEALLDRRKEIIELKTDEVRRLAELAIATRFSCGGNNCG